MNRIMSQILVDYRLEAQPLAIPITPNAPTNFVKSQATLAGHCVSPQGTDCTESPGHALPPFSGGVHLLYLVFCPLGSFLSHQQGLEQDPHLPHACHFPSTIWWSCPTSDLPFSFSTKNEPKCCSSVESMIKLIVLYFPLGSSEISMPSSSSCPVLSSMVCCGTSCTYKTLAWVIWSAWSRVTCEIL